MKIYVTQSYKHNEIKDLLVNCPICHQCDQLSSWADVRNKAHDRGNEGITCMRCNFNIVFNFRASDSQVVDEYNFNYVKIDNLEFKNDNNRLAMYLNNTHVRDMEQEFIDLDKCRSWALVS